MLSPSDTILIFVVALLLFGPEQLPKIARQLGDAMRHVQSSTSAFMAEMDRAAAAHERAAEPQWHPPKTDVVDADTHGHSSAADDASTLPGTTQQPEEAADAESDSVEQARDSPNSSP